MECLECGDRGAESVRIEYVERSAETLRLCSQCRNEFEDGDLVTDVTAVSVGGDDS